MLINFMSTTQPQIYIPQKFVVVPGILHAESIFLLFLNP